MLAASVWSLIVPAIDSSSHLNSLSFLPATIGIIAGLLFLIIVDKTYSNLIDKNCNLTNQKNKSRMLMLAVTLHNIPEGMAVGVAMAGVWFGNAGVSLSASLALSLGIAIQNIPEGAIISMPLLSKGCSKLKSFFIGVLSGVVEPIAAIITILLVNILSPILPYLLAFAAGAMIYVVVQELIPESHDEHSKGSTIAFMVGFLAMMILDVALG
jgi:ZIP family zinc transporter